jgi:iron complex transport system substrate-binding protein
MNEPVEDPLLLGWMAEVFYPDIMPRNLRDEYKESYQEVYHYSISDDEIEKAIYLVENRRSAGYERFER